MGKITNITVAGLGGQGVLKVTDILAEVLFAAGYDVKKSEVHGMSQRGGSVSSEVRYGGEVASPMVPAGEAHVLAVLESGQLEVVRPLLREGGVVITPEDLPHFLDKFKKDKIMRAIRDKGKYIIRYNMIYKDAVIPVSLRFATTQEGERTMLIAGARKESDDQQG